MSSQDDLTLLKQMHQRAEITDDQYDVLRRHVLWGTPLPKLIDDLPAAPPSPGGRRRRAEEPAPAAGFPPPTVPPPGGPGLAPPTVPPQPGPGLAPPSVPPSGGPGLAPPGGFDFPPPGTPPVTGRRRRAEEDPPAYLPLGGPSSGGRRRAPEDPPGLPVPGAGPATTAFPPPLDRDVALEETATYQPFPAVQDPVRRAPALDETAAHQLFGAVQDAPGETRHGATRLGAAGERPPDGTTGAYQPIGADDDDRPEDEDRPARPAPGRRRPRKRNVFAVLASMVLALALVAAGVYWFTLREIGVPPADYARSICGSVRDWHQSVDAASSTLVSTIAREDDRATVRTAVGTYYTGLAGRTDQLRVTLIGSGVADVSGGQAYADSLAAAVGDQATALRELSARTAQLNPRAVTFQASLQSLLTGSETAVSEVSAALARPTAGTPPALRTALSDEPACAPYVG